MNNRLLTFAALAATFAACSTVPERNDALEQARARYTTARNDPQIGRLAPDELKRASDALDQAKVAWSAGRPAASVSHLAYMAGQRVTIAQETATSRAAQAVTTGAAAERDALRLAKRTQEADAAQAALTASQQSDARKTSELAAADANAQRSQARASDLETQLAALNAKKTDRGMVVTVGDVLFDSGQSRLLPQGTRNMSQLAEVFKGNPQSKASIDGFTDSIGSSASNVDLSQRRANAVMAALVQLGVPADRLSTQGFGEEQPAASNATAAGRQMNRRVEIVFAPSGADASSRQP